MLIRSKHLIAGYIVALIALAFMFLGDYTYIDQVDLLYIFLIFVLAFLPTLIYLLSKSESKLIPLMPLHGVFYGAVMGWPALSNKTRWWSENSDSITDALVVASLGLLALNLGYFLTKFLLKERRSPIQFLLRISPNKESFIGWTLFLLYLLFTIFPQLSDLPSVQHIGPVAMYLSLGILFNCLIKNKLSSIQKILYLIAFSFAVLSHVFIGQLAGAVFLFILIGLIYWQENKKMPLAFVMAVLLIIVALNPVKHVFRSVTENEIVANLSFAERSVLFVNSIQIFFNSGGSFYSILSSDSSTVNRFAHIASLSKVVEKTPNEVPYWMGETYKPLFTFFIPRILWADKPSENSGQTFGHRYSFLLPDDVTTSYNLPWITELYANFGIIGVIIGMLLIGFFFRLLVNYLSIDTPNRIEFILGLSVTFELFFADSNFSLLANGVFFKYILSLVLLRILSLKFNLGGQKTALD